MLCRARGASYLRPIRFFVRETDGVCVVQITRKKEEINSLNEHGADDDLYMLSCLFE
jgi:hypothetical protein